MWLYLPLRHASSPEHAIQSAGIAGHLVPRPPSGAPCDPVPPATPAAPAGCGQVVTAPVGADVKATADQADVAWAQPSIKAAARSGVRGLVARGHRGRKMPSYKARPGRVPAATRNTTKTMAWVAGTTTAGMVAWVEWEQQSRESTKAHTHACWQHPPSPNSVHAVPGICCTKELAGTTYLARAPATGSRRPLLGAPARCAVFSRNCVHSTTEGRKASRQAGRQAGRQAAGRKARTRAACLYNHAAVIGGVVQEVRRREALFDECIPHSVDRWERELQRRAKRPRAHRQR
jgi:hypothetical protein